jgi:hypothetical protein
VKQLKHDKLTEEQIALRMMNLAFRASSAMGMGFLHFVPDQKTEDSTFKDGITTDYRGDSSLYGDYIQGRMVKLSIGWNDKGVKVTEELPRADYQSWSTTYSTYEDLYNSAVKELEEGK